MQYINTGMAFDGAGVPYEVIVPIRKIIDKQHVNMLRFLDADIGSISRQVSSYIKDRFGRARYEVPDAVYRDFSELHPYYALNEANISVALNRAFAGAVHVRYEKDKEREKKMASMYTRRGLGSKCDTEHWLYLDPGREEPDADLIDTPLRTLEETQKKVRTAAILLLDDGTPILEGLSPYQRLAIYGTVSSDGFGGPADGFLRLGRMAFTYGCVQGTDSRALSARIDFADDDALNMENLQREMDVIASDPHAATPAISCAISLLNGSGRLRTDEILVPESLEDLLLYEITEMFAKGIRLRRNDSGRFEIPQGTVDAPFLPSDPKEELKTIYRRAYKTHHRRVANSLLSDSQFHDWVKEAAEMQEKVLDGEITIGEFEMWAKR